MQHMGGSKKPGNILPNIDGLFLCPFLKTFSSTLYCLSSATECTQVGMFIWDLKSSVFNVFSHAHSRQVISPLVVCTRFKHALCPSHISASTVCKQFICFYSAREKSFLPRHFLVFHSHVALLCS